MSVTLLQLQTAHGARWSADGMTLIDYGDTPGEYRAAREQCVLVDQSDREQVELTGADRHRFLHNFCTNDIKKLAPGSGCEAFVPNIKGKIIGQLAIFAHADRLRCDTGTKTAAALIAHLDRYLLSEDVQLHQRTENLAALGLIGPLSRQVVATALGLTLPDVPWRAAKEGETELCSLPLLHPTQLQLIIPREQLATVWQQLVAAGARPAGTAVVEALRLEAGLPRYLVDIDDDTLAQEASRTKQAISFNKGCYLGQETIARIDAVGHTNRQVVRLRTSGTDVPAPGAKLLDPTGRQEVGCATSAVRHPLDGDILLLAMVRREQLASGTQLPFSEQPSRTAVVQ